MQIGRLIEKWIAGGHTAKEMAANLGCNGQSITDWRRGTRPVSEDMQPRLATALGIELKEVEEAAEADKRLRKALAKYLADADFNTQWNLAAALHRAAEQGFKDWHTLFAGPSETEAAEPPERQGPMLSRHGGPPRVKKPT